MAVEDLPFEALQYACKQVFRHETFMPVPAILRSYALDWQRQQRTMQSQAQQQRERAQLALEEVRITTEEIRRLIQSALPGYGWEPVEEPRNAAN